jgi:hypothetical protein
MSYQLVETKTLGATAASIEFTSIPQDATDLVLKMSLRYNGTPGSPQQPVSFSFNSSGTNKTSRVLYGDGSGVASSSYTEFYDWINTTSTTSNTFSNGELYITNYAGSTNKSALVDGVIENNTTPSWLQIGTLLWSNTAAITSIQIAGIAYSLVAGSTISLYKITRGTSNGVVVS